MIRIIRNNFQAQPKKEINRYYKL